MKKLQKPLTERVLRLVQNGVEGEDSRALLELYVMLNWTADGENWDYWSWKSFRQLRERYCPRCGKRIATGRIRRKSTPGNDTGKGFASQNP